MADDIWGLREAALDSNYIGQATMVRVGVSLRRRTGTREVQEFFRWNYEQHGDGPVTRIPEYRTVTYNVYEDTDLSGATVEVTWQAGAYSGTIGTATLDSQSKAALPWVVDPLIATLDITKQWGFDWTVSVKVTKGALQHTFSQRGSGLAIPSDVKPRVVDWQISEGNPDLVGSGLPFIAGLSIVKAAPVIEGTFGAAIRSQTVKFGTTVIPSEGLPVTGSGTYTVQVAAEDSRGLTLYGSLDDGGRTTVAVAAYGPPLLDWAVERVNAAGVADGAGLRLKVHLDTTVSYLGGANPHQIRVYTRPKGASSWTPRNVINSASTSYAAAVMVDGGGIYDKAQGWEVRVEVEDAVTVTADEAVVASGGMIIDSDREHTAIGMYVEPDGPPVQIAGPAKVYGTIDADNMPIRRQIGTKSPGVGTLTVPLVGFYSVPEVTLTPVYNSSTAPSVWLSSLTTTSMTIRCSQASATVHYSAVEYPYTPTLALQTSEYIWFGYSTPQAGQIIFVGLVEPGQAQTAFASDQPEGGNQYRSLDVPTSGTAVTGGLASRSTHQLENGVLIAWFTGNVSAIGAYNSVTQRWTGAFSAELYVGAVPPSDAKKITKRILKQLGVNIALGPQFD